MPDLNDAVTAYFAALPVFGNNTVGRASRDTIINRVMGALPGAHTRPWPQSSKPPYRDIFYPGWSQNPNTASLNAVLGFGDTWWSDLSVVTTCQVIANVTSDIRGQMKSGDINSRVGGYNNEMRPKLNDFYGRLLTTIADSPATPPYNQIGAGNMQKAAQIYQDALKNPAWISAKVGQAASGQWTNQVWELFHHWIKLRALGTDAGTIDALINQLKSAGLPVPDSVSAGRWQNYRPWLQPDVIDWQDFKAKATPGALQRNCTSYGGGMPSCMNEENSYEFTANSQPGSPWRQAPGGSCFLPGTQILMADGSLKRIETVAAGDIVRTRDGEARVLTVVSLLHGGDSAFRLGGTEFCFTRTHPFFTCAGATGGDGPKFACVDPIMLMNTVPTLSHLGLTPLAGGARLELARFADGTISPFAVERVEARAIAPGQQKIYDLVVAFDSDGLSEYIAGDGTTMLVVNSEAPCFGMAPLATEVLLDMVETAWPVVQSTLAEVAPERWLAVLYQGLYAASTTLVVEAARLLLLRRAPRAAAAAEARGISKSAARERAHRMAASLMAHAGGAAPPVYDGPKGAFFAMVLGIFGDEINDIVATGWRDFAKVEDVDATMLAATLLSFELIDLPGKRFEGPATVTVTLGEGAGAVTLGLKPTTLGYFRQLGQTAYLDSWRPLKDATWAFEIALGRPGEPLNVLKAEAPMPGQIDDGYRLFNMPLQDCDGQVAGQISFDARPFNEQRLENEIRAAQIWNDEARHAFAHRLAESAARLLAERFPTAVGPYLHPRAA